MSPRPRLIIPETNSPSVSQLPGRQRQLLTPATDVPKIRRQPQPAPSTRLLTNPAPTATSPRYACHQQIGSGNTATVYLASDYHEQRPVAIKRFSPDLHPNILPDHLSELTAISRLNNKHVVRTFDHGADCNGHFLVMELIEGLDLKTAVRHQSPHMPHFFDFALQTLEGLRAIHEAGLLHLDLKPSNIMLSRKHSTEDATVKLIDLGQAKLTQDAQDTETTSGTHSSIHFSAPEQLRCEKLSKSTDLYSLGCIFYWSLSGRHPFEGENVMHIMAAHLQHFVEPLNTLNTEIPQWLSDWVMKLIDLNASDRPQSTEEAIATLRGGLAQQAITQQSA